MLSNPDEAAKESAAQAIFVASFRVKNAEQDLDLVMKSDEVCRAAVALMAAGNLQYAEVAKRSRDLLIAAFNDTSSKVRDAAARCFHEISEEQLCSEPKLIGLFLIARRLKIMHTASL